MAKKKLKIDITFCLMCIFIYFVDIFLFIGYLTNTYKNIGITIFYIILSIWYIYLIVYKNSLFVEKGDI